MKFLRVADCLFHLVARVELHELSGAADRYGRADLNAAEENIRREERARGNHRNARHRSRGNSENHACLFLFDLDGLDALELTENHILIDIVGRVNAVGSKSVFNSIKIVFHITHSKNCLILPSARDRRDRTVEGFMRNICAIS